MLIKYTNYNSFYFEKNVLNTLLIHKLNILHYYNLPKIKKVCLHFFLNNMDNYDNELVLQFFYMINFILGQKAYIHELSHTFKKGKKDYKIILQVFIKNKNISSFLFYLASTILPQIGKQENATNINIINNYFFLLIGHLRELTDFEVDPYLFQWINKILVIILFNSKKSIEKKILLKCWKIMIK